MQINQFVCVPGSGMLEFEEFTELAAKFLIEEDEEELVESEEEEWKVGRYHLQLNNSTGVDVQTQVVTTF